MKRFSTEKIKRKAKRAEKRMEKSKSKLNPDSRIIVELDGEPWKEGTVREIADQFDIDLSKFNSLTKEAFESTLQGLNGGKIEIKEGHKH